MMHWRMSARTLLALWHEARPHKLGLRQHNSIFFWMALPVLIDRAVPYKQLLLLPEGMPCR